MFGPGRRKPWQCVEKVFSTAGLVLWTSRRSRSCPTYSPTHLMEQPGPVFSFLPFPLHCSLLTPGTESSCWYVATFRDQFSTHMGFSTIGVNVLLALPFCSFLFKCLHFLRFLWAVRNLSFCIRTSCMKSALPSQETDWLWQQQTAASLLLPTLR